MAFHPLPPFRLTKRAPAESTASITLPLVTVMEADSLLGNERGLAGDAALRFALLPVIAALEV